MRIREIVDYCRLLVTVFVGVVTLLYRSGRKEEKSGHIRQLG